MNEQPKSVRVSLTKESAESLIQALYSWVEYARTNRYKGSVELGEPLYKAMKEKFESAKGSTVTFSMTLDNVILLHGAVSDYAIFEGGDMQVLISIGELLEAKAKKYHAENHLCPNRGTENWAEEKKQLQKGHATIDRFEGVLKGYELEALKLLSKVGETTELGIREYLKWKKEEVSARVRELVKKKLLCYSGGGWVDITAKGKMYGKPFYQQYSEGEVGIEAIDDFIDEWHEGFSGLPIFEFLGLTEQQYAHWVETEVLE